MKRYVTIGMLVFLSLTLISCASNRFPILNMDLTCERWQCLIDSNPNRWMRAASSWFLAGRPSYIEVLNSHAPYSAVIGTMSIKAPDFTTIKAKGIFKLQIYQSDGPNTISILGPNEGIRNISITTNGRTLCIQQVNPCPSVRRIIVRVGVKHLRSLIQLGPGSIEASNIVSPCLYITSTVQASGNIYLSGDVNVRCIDHQGSGCIIIDGADTPSLIIKACGRGAINVAGHVGIRSIVHHGSNDVNIIGADSGCLTIYADGCGKIGIDGQVNLKSIRAKDKVRVLIASVNSHYVYAYLCGCAFVGLSGCTRDLYVEASGGSFFAGRYLCSNNAFVKARDTAHINVTTATRIFASSTDNSSVYFFGSPDLLSQFVNGNGTVFPIYGVRAACCSTRPPPCGRYRCHRRPACYRGAG